VTDTFTPQQQAVIDRVESDLVSGRYFDRIAISNRSVPLGRPPIASRHWAAIMKALATYAADGDRAAATAAKVFGKVNLYLTPNEVIAQVAEVLAKVVREGYFDVIGATGPEGGRRSAHQHPTDLRQAIRLALLMVEVEMVAGYLGHLPGLGWALAHLVERENVSVSHWLYPTLAAALAKKEVS
jgi:hypothetical protein